MNHQHWMEAALSEARVAFSEGEIPVGAVAVFENQVIASDHNRVEQLRDASAHAEMLVLRKAAAALQRWRLTGVSIIMTVEPCPMCAMAMVLFRIDEAVFGALEPRTGGVASFMNILGNPGLNHKPRVIAGVLADESSVLLRNFFKMRRDGAEMSD
jgi:tRNA(adenine34) deaminase